MISPQRVPLLVIIMLFMRSKPNKTDLSNDERFKDVHLEDKVLSYIGEETWEGTLKQ